MGKDGLAAWALANGRVADDQPSSPGEAIVRMALKATVVNLEVRKPAGKWRKAYGKIQPDPDAGLPLGPGLDTTRASRCSCGRTRTAWSLRG
jgi:hypothetical protein